MSKTPPNASIIRLSDCAAYGVRIEDDGSVTYCSEHSAGLDSRGPLAWLHEHYPSQEFRILRDGACAYRADLRASLFGTDADLLRVRQETRAALGRDS